MFLFCCYCPGLTNFGKCTWNRSITKSNIKALNTDFTKKESFNLRCCKLFKTIGFAKVSAAQRAYKSNKPKIRQTQGIKSKLVTPENMITIIGAGPIGLRTAELLAKKGRQVVVLEDHPEIGVPVQCTGIVTKSLGEIVPLKKEFVVNQLKKVCVNAPNKKSVEIPNDDIVINRTKFDKWLAKQAEKAGAKIILNKRVEEITRTEAVQKNIVLKIRDTKTGEKKIHRTDILIGADGPGSIVSKEIGNPKPKCWIGVQARVRMPVDKTTYSVFFGEHIPGFFGWIVPETDSVARVGIAAEKNPLPIFNKFIKQFGKYRIVEKQGGLIPEYNHDLVIQKNNMYLIGDSATQVKAITGGGLVPGLKAAECLANAIVNKTDYFASLSKVSHNLYTNLKLRKMLNKFRDGDYNKLIELLCKPKIKKVLEEHDRDHATQLVIRLALKEPRLLLFGRALLRTTQPAKFLNSKRTC